MDTEIEEEGVVVMGNAFYNPAQKFNRTMTIKIIKEYLEKRRQDKEHPKKNTEENANREMVLLECMSATGLRGIRYCKEIEGPRKIVLNDISEKACREIEENCRKNSVPAELGKKISTGSLTVEIRNEDCRVLMLQNKKAFDVIDIDPFGTCAPFIECAIESLSEGGLLCVTSTDTKVLCGKPPESCVRSYGTASPNCSFSHEAAVRTVLSFISRTSSRLGRNMVPLVSLSVDFFVRVFVTIQTDRRAASMSILYNSYYGLCVCLNREEQHILKKDGAAYKHAKICSNMCTLCGRTLPIYGPFWNRAMCQREFVRGVIDKIDKGHVEEKTGGIVQTAASSSQIDRRIHGMLSLAIEEEESVFYCHLPYLCSVLEMPVVPIAAFVSFLEHNGFSSSLTHCKPNSIKTNTPAVVLYIGVVEYHRKFSPEVYEKFAGRLGPVEERPTNEQRASVIFENMKKHMEKNTIRIDFSITDKAKLLTSRRFLKFQDKEGLGWGPMKKGAARQPQASSSTPE